MKLSVILVLLVVVAVVSGWERERKYQQDSDSDSKSSKSHSKSTKSHSDSKSRKSHSDSKSSKSDSDSKSGKSDSDSKSDKSDSHSKSSKSYSHSKSKSKKSHSHSSSKSSHSKSKSDSDSKSSESRVHPPPRTEEPKTEPITIDCPARKALQCWQCRARDHDKCRSAGKWQTCQKRQTCFLEEYKDVSGKQQVVRGCRSLSVCRKADYLYPHCLRSAKKYQCATCGPRCGFQCVEKEKECQVKCRKCRCATQRQCRKLNTYETCEGYKSPMCQEKTITLKDGKSVFISGCSEGNDCLNHDALYPKCYYSKEYYSKTCVQCTKPQEIDCKPTNTPKPTTQKPTTPKPTTPKPTTPKPTTPKPTTPKPTTPKPTTPKPTTPKPTTPKPKCPEEANTKLTYKNRRDMRVLIFGPRVDSLLPFNSFLQGSKKQLLFVINDDVPNTVRVDFKKPQNIAGITAQSKFSDYVQATVYTATGSKVFKQTSSTSNKWKPVNIQVSPTQLGVTRVDFEFGYGNSNEIRVKAGFFTTCPE